VFGLAPTTDISLLLTGGMLAVSEIRLTGLVEKRKHRSKSQGLHHMSHGLIIYCVVFWV